MLLVLNFNLLLSYSIQFAPVITRLQNYVPSNPTLVKYFSVKWWWWPKASAWLTSSSHDSLCTPVCLVCSLNYNIFPALTKNFGSTHYITFNSFSLLTHIGSLFFYTTYNKLNLAKCSFSQQNIYSQINSWMPSISLRLPQVLYSSPEPQWLNLAPQCGLNLQSARTIWYSSNWIDQYRTQWRTKI